MDDDAAFVCVGSVRPGEYAVPANAEDAIDFSAGASHGLFLTAEGTVQSWGDGPGASVSDLNQAPSVLDYIVEIGEGQTCFIARQGPGKLLPPAPLDGPSLHWVTDEALPWFPESSVTHDSVDALQSRALQPGQRAGARTKVLGPGLLKYFLSWQPAGLNNCRHAWK